MSLLRSITRLSIERDSSATASTVLADVIQQLSTITLALVESLRGCIVVLVSEQSLSSSLSSERISVGFCGAVLSNWLLLSLLLLLLVDALSGTVYSGLITVIWVKGSATAAATGKWSIDSAKLFVSLDNVIQTTSHFNVVVHLTIT